MKPFVARVPARKNGDVDGEIIELGLKVMKKRNSRFRKLSEKQGTAIIFDSFQWHGSADGVDIPYYTVHFLVRE